MAHSIDIIPQHKQKFSKSLSRRQGYCPRQGHLPPPPVSAAPRPTLSARKHPSAPHGLSLTPVSHCGAVTVPSICVVLAIGVCEKKCIISMRMTLKLVIKLLAHVTLHSMLNPPISK